MKKLKTVVFQGVMLIILVSSCSTEETAPTIIGKWKTVIVEGKPVTGEFSYWEFFNTGMVEIVKWDNGRIEMSMTAKWGQANRGDSAFLIVEAAGRQMEFPMFLYADSLITIDPSRIDRSYKGRTVWQRIESSTPKTTNNEPAQAGRPTDEQITTAVHKALTQNVPGPLVRYATGGKKARIAELRINAQGKPQAERNTTYWPVKIFSKGSCEVLFGGRKSFEGEIEYFVYQDPYGEWKAEYRGL
ncbi:MAG: hypothetical protein PHR28_03740 [candidate division Zixibacteria bacterium]|nr:hypothetical protein [candidate division Zixibacteria bacterium]